MRGGAAWSPTFPPPNLPAVLSSIARARSSMPSSTSRRAAAPGDCCPTTSRPVEDRLANFFLVGTEQEDEQRLRASAGELGSLYLRCYESPYGEEIVSLVRVFTAYCSGSEPMRTWPHERLFGRPQTKDSLSCRRKRHVQGPGGSHLLRLALLGQTLPRQGKQGRIAGFEEEARIYSEARPEGEEPSCRRSAGTSLPHSSGALPVHRNRNGALGESLDDVSRHSPLRPHKEKGGDLPPSATSLPGPPGG